MKLAVATLVAVSDQNPCTTGYQCALIPWCYSATRLQQLIEQSTPHSLSLYVLMPGSDYSQLYTRTHVAPGKRCLLNEDTEFSDLRNCPHAGLVSLDPQLTKLIDAHKARVIKSGVMSYSPQYIRRMTHTLHKWKLLSMTREHALDAILFADVDVEVCPTEVCHSLAGRRLVSDEWNARVAALVAESRTNGSEFVVLGAGDVTTPFNAGLFWVFPSALTRRVYHQGLALLRSPWNFSHGFGRLGTPRELWQADRASNVHSKFFRGWDAIDGGDLDQGLFLAALHAKRKLLRLRAWKRASKHKAVHYVTGPRKPWFRALYYKAIVPNATLEECESNQHEHRMRYFYLNSFKTVRSGPADLAEHDAPTECSLAFQTARAELEEFENYSTCCASRHGKPCARMYGQRGGHILLNVF